MRLAAARSVLHAIAQQLLQDSSEELPVTMHAGIL